MTTHTTPTLIGNLSNDDGNAKDITLHYLRISQLYRFVKSTYLSQNLLKTNL